MTLPPAFLQAPFAHRGLHDVTDGRPENSRAAIRAAMAAGYGIEIDVQLSRDAQAMVFHDYDLERLTGQEGVVQRQDAAALSQIRLLGGDEGVPTLPEVLEMINGAVPLLVEIKDQDGGMGPDIGPLEEATANALRAYTGPVAVMSFNPHAVARMAELLPDTPRGLTTSGYDPLDWPLSKSTCDTLRDIPDYDRTGACFISHEAADLARPRVAELKAQGAMVCCWTITSPEEEAKARVIADNVTFEGYLAPLNA